MKFLVPTPPMAVGRVFDGYPAAVRKQLLKVRDIIFKTAAQTTGVGPIEETLKWGEPAYLTSTSGSGSTIRLGWSRKTPQQFGIYFNCQTTLVDDFRSWFPNQLHFEGNRAIVFNERDTIPVREIESCVESALTYHVRKRRKSV